jgi:hypothetical protein
MGVNEHKINIENKIMELFESNPEVDPNSEKWPKTRNIYNLSNIIQYVNSDKNKVNFIFYDMIRKNKKIKNIKVINYEYEESFPYYYNIDYISDEKALESKNLIEEKSKRLFKLKEIDKSL